MTPLILSLVPVGTEGQDTLLSASSQGENFPKILSFISHRPLDTVYYRHAAESAEGNFFQLSHKRIFHGPDPHAGPSDPL